MAKSGVYLLFELGELRSSREEPRVVRVGSHRVRRWSKATLWDRLRTHIGAQQMVVGIAVVAFFGYTLGRLSQLGILLLGFPHGG